MEPVLAILVGLFVTGAVYLMLSPALVRIVLGVVLLGSGINLLIFTAGRVTRAIPPIVPAGQAAPLGYFANPLPQALILTAIVIGFGIFVYLIVLTFRAYQALDADHTDRMRVAEPEPGPQPPLEY